MHVQELEMEDIKRYFEEFKFNERLTKLYVEHNTAGKTFDELFETMKFDTFLTADDAVKNGFADKVVTQEIGKYLYENTLIIEQQLEEGPNDPHIFKAVRKWSGSGKTFVANKMLARLIRVINSDEVYEMQ